MIVCSRAANWNSKLKADGKRVPKRTESAMECGCGWMLKISQSKKILPKVRLLEVKPYHNHLCNIAGAVVSYKKSGKCFEEAISQVTQMLAPLILSKRPVPFNLIRWTIKPHLSTGIIS